MLRGWLGAVPLGEDSPALLEEFLTGEEHTFDSVTVGGSTVWSSIADYRPPPLEVLRNPWIQWSVVLPRDITGPRYEGIHRWGPAALKALGVTDALTHMEWFARPDGSVAVSEVAARPPGAQLTSMHGYAHDFDLYRAWAELVILGRFDVPERRFAAGTAYLRGLGHGRVRAVHGIDAVQQQIGHLVVEARLPQAGAARGQRLPGRGVRDRARPRHRGGGGRAAPHRQRGPRRAGRGLDGRPAMNIVMLSPGYPAEMAYFTRALAGGGRPGHRGRRPAAARAARGGPLGARALRARESRRRGRGARGVARAVPARLDRPGGVPLGAVHDPGRPHPGDVRPARPHRRADRARSGTRRR